MELLRMITGYNLKFSLLLTIILFTSHLAAKENSIKGVIVNLNVNEEGAVSPDFFIPYYWNNQLYTGIGYQSWEDTSQDAVDGYSESRISENNKFSQWRLSLLNWQSKPKPFMFTLGAELQQTEMNKYEFGYIHFPDNLGGEWVAFDNDVNVKVIQPTINAGMRWTNQANTLAVFIEGLVTPLSLLDLDQKTEFKPIINDTGISSGRNKQDLSWEINSNMEYKTDIFADLGFSVSYEYLPLSYDLATLDYNSNTSAFSFSTSNIEIEQIVMTWEVELILKVNILGDAKPKIGFGQRITNIKDKVSHDSEKLTDNLISIGFKHNL